MGSWEGGASWCRVYAAISVWMGKVQSRLEARPRTP
jgi:hypothetical protein